MKRIKISKREIARFCFAIFLWLLVVAALFVLVSYRTCPKVWRQYWPNLRVIVSVVLCLDFCGIRYVFYGAGVAAVLGLVVFIIRRR